MPKRMKSQGQVNYHLDEKGCFIIDQYNKSKPFSNFFPGVAGEWGVPMWVFYVNRGQAIAGFGIESKDKAIMEFVPANKAYRQTGVQGFRTFLKVKSGNKITTWEPFQDLGPSGVATKQTMSVTSHDLTISDTHPALKLEVSVNYFTIANENYPALVRCLTIKNLSSRSVSYELIDGLPVFLPYGISDWVVKNMCRTVEAWVKVKNIEDRIPYYHLNVEVNDTPDVRHITEGFFYFNYEEKGGKRELSPVVVEPAVIFGSDTGFGVPQVFYQENKYKVPAGQQTASRTPSAFSYAHATLAPASSRQYVSFIGHTHNEEHHKKIVRQATTAGFVAKKAQENRQLVEKIKSYVFTASDSTEFDLYTGQTFLDNVLRGGLPVSLKTREGQVVFNVFSRKHGDMERDYNYFRLAPTYFSQGNGSYRDVNQNRRNDIWFNRDVAESSVVNFLSLIQADGYNPLVVKGLSFVVENPEKADSVLHHCLPTGDCAAVKDILIAGFQPGELLRIIEQKGIQLKVSAADFLGRILDLCHKNEVAEHGEGFWIDHWTYNLDLIESFLSVYPEKKRDLLLEKRVFSFYLNSHYVLTRAQRYLLTSRGVRQYHSVKNDNKNINAEGCGNKLRIDDGEGEVYLTNLLVKLLSIAANKAATFDPSGIGIEMEADKPSWYDALNGLPGLLGSSICESLELKRLAIFVLDSLAALKVPEENSIWMYCELATFVQELSVLFKEEKEPRALWHKGNDIKEHYRSRVRNGIEGREHEISVLEIKEFLQQVIERVDSGVEKAKDKNGLIPTYFYHTVTDYALLPEKHNDQNYVLPVNFKRHDLPLFLEGFVHALRVERDLDEARSLYKKIKQSPLFDRELKMYKVNADLSKESEEIGRTRIFPAGWLENESIWLHMEYKYCLELFRCGLYEEFYETFKDILVPFQDATCYGRSTLENSSFIVSSVHVDARVHGQGFVARLSGSTAEGVHMWLWMTAGKEPFVLDHDGHLTLVLKPVLPGWLFTKKSRDVDCLTTDGQTKKLSLPAGSFAFTFAGTTRVIYHNPKRQDTFGKKPATIKELTLRYRGHKDVIKINGGTIPQPYAADIREDKVEEIHGYFE